MFLKDQFLAVTLGAKYICYLLIYGLLIKNGENLFNPLPYHCFQNVQIVSLFYMTAQDGCTRSSSLTY